MSMLGAIKPDAQPGTFDFALMQALSRLYRSRPFTKSIPFAKTLVDASDQFVLWTPIAATFELAYLIVKSANAYDGQLCDTTPDNAFLLFDCDNTGFKTYDILPGYRSNQTNSSKLLLTNPNGITGVIKGTLLGWEVTRDGYYR
jgi:hypothetical protein